jgi:cell division protein FtsN
MMEQSAESGIEVVLDNRKLIIAFAVLIAICGGFFVLGFIEGKRQGYQEGAQTAAESATFNISGQSPAQSSQPKDVDKTSEPLPAGSESQPLNWYKSVNRKEGEPEVLPKPASESPAVRTEETSSTTKPAAKPKTESVAARTGPVTYSVQVGAFVQQKEAETRAKELRSKGFDCRIEPPVPPQQFYLLKVGKFDTRVDAVAMQLRLKKSGFPCFVKTN